MGRRGWLFKKFWSVLFPKTPSTAAAGKLELNQASFFLFFIFLHPPKMCAMTRTLSFSPSGDIAFSSTGNHVILLWQTGWQDSIVNDCRPETTTHATNISVNSLFGAGDFIQKEVEHYFCTIQTLQPCKWKFHFLPCFFSNKNKKNDFCLVRLWFLIKSCKIIKMFFDEPAKLGSWLVTFAVLAVQCQPRWVPALSSPRPSAGRMFPGFAPCAIPEQPCRTMVALTCKSRMLLLAAAFVMSCLLLST